MTEQKKEVAGYKGHKVGSRKGTIHELFDREGADTAWTRGLKMKLKESTLRSWLQSWGGSKPKAKAKPAPNAKKATKVKAEEAPKPNGGAEAVATA